MAGEGLAIPALLRQLARELDALQRMAAEMECAVDGMIERHAGTLDAASMRNLQLLDILGQSLQALATFAGNAAALASPAWRLDGGAAAADLTLASLAQRLAAGEGDAASAAADGVELFQDG
jgi:hypothetical protein